MTTSAKSIDLQISVHFQLFIVIKFHASKKPKYFHSRLEWYGLFSQKDRHSGMLRDDGCFGWILCLSESLWRVSEPSVDPSAYQWTSCGLVESSFKSGRSNSNFIFVPWTFWMRFRSTDGYKLSTGNHRLSVTWNQWDVVDSSSAKSELHVHGQSRIVSGLFTNISGLLVDACIYA